MPPTSRNQGIGISIDAEGVDADVIAQYIAAVISPKPPEFTLSGLDHENVEHVVIENANAVLSDGSPLSDFDFAKYDISRSNLGFYLTFLSTLAIGLIRLATVSYSRDEEIGLIEEKVSLVKRPELNYIELPVNSNANIYNDFFEKSRRWDDVGQKINNTERLNMIARFSLSSLFQNLSKQTLNARLEGKIERDQIQTDLKKIKDHFRIE